MPLFYNTFETALRFFPSHSDCRKRLTTIDTQYNPECYKKSIFFFEFREEVGQIRLFGIVLLPRYLKIGQLVFPLYLAQALHAGEGQMADVLQIFVEVNVAQLFAFGKCLTLDALNVGAKIQVPQAAAALKSALADDAAVILKGDVPQRRTLGKGGFTDVRVDFHRPERVAPGKNISAHAGDGAGNVRTPEGCTALKGIIPDGLHGRRELDRTQCAALGERAVADGCHIRPQIHRLDHGKIPAGFLSNLLHIQRQHGDVFQSFRKRLLGFQFAGQNVAADLQLIVGVENIVGAVGQGSLTFQSLLGLPVFDFFVFRPGILQLRQRVFIRLAGFQTAAAGKQQGPGQRQRKQSFFHRSSLL